MIKKTFIGLTLFAVMAVPAALAQSEVEASCDTVASSVRAAVKASPDNVVAIVDREVLANPSCSCEIVKEAIKAAGASNETVAAIVRVAALAAPEQMGVIGVCATGVAPDSATEVQKTLLALASEMGSWNPLNFPVHSGTGNGFGTLPANGQNNIGVNPSTGGPFVLFPPLGPNAITPPNITPFVPNVPGTPTDMGSSSSGGSTGGSQSP